MRNIAPQEKWYRWWGGKAIFQQAPLYAYWVAGLLAVSRRSIEFVSLVQLLVGAFQPLVVFWLGRRLFDAGVGLLAAALTALYGPFIFHQSVLLRDWLPPILEPLALVAPLRARDRGRVGNWALAGAALGLALLAKETLLLFVPLAATRLHVSYPGPCSYPVAGRGVPAPLDAAPVLGTSCWGIELLAWRSAPIRTGGGSMFCVAKHLLEGAPDTPAKPSGANPGLEAIKGTLGR